MATGPLKRGGTNVPARRIVEPDAPARVPYAIQVLRALRGISTRQVPSLHRTILIYVASFANPDGSECVPKLATLSKRSGFGLTRSKQILRELEGGRWIERVNKRWPDGTQTSTRYVIHLNGGKIVPAPRPKRLTVDGAGRAVLHAHPPVVDPDAPTKH